MKMFEFLKKILEMCFWGYDPTMVNTGSYNGLAAGLGPCEYQIYQYEYEYMYLQHVWIQVRVRVLDFYIRMSLSNSNGRRFIL